MNTADLRYFVMTWTARRNSKRRSGLHYLLAADQREAERKLHRLLRDRYPGHRIVVTLTGTLPA